MKRLIAATTLLLGASSIIAGTDTLWSTLGPAGQPYNFAGWTIASGDSSGGFQTVGQPLFLESTSIVAETVVALAPNAAIYQPIDVVLSLDEDGAPGSPVHVWTLTDLPPFNWDPVASLVSLPLDPGVVLRARQRYWFTISPGTTAPDQLEAIWLWGSGITGQVIDRHAPADPWRQAGAMPWGSLAVHGVVDGIFSDGTFEHPTGTACGAHVRDCGFEAFMWPSGGQWAATDDAPANPPYPKIVSSSLARTGGWMAQFGGRGVNSPNEVGLSQILVVPDATAAMLTIHVATEWCSDPCDSLHVSIDGQELFRITTDEVNPEGCVFAEQSPLVYRPQTIDLAAYADGESHELSIGASFSGAAVTPGSFGGVGRFYVDDIDLITAN